MSEPADAEFWTGVEESMGGPSSRAHGERDVEALAGDLTDGLNPDETWDDVW